MQPQPSKNTYNNGSQKPVNNPKQPRTNQSSRSNGNRQQNYSANTPRNRFIQQPTAVFPSLHPGIVMGQFNPTVYTSRSTYLQQCQYPAQFFPQIYYPYYVPQITQQQQPHQQNANASTIMGLMTVQPGTFVSGPAGNQAAMQIPGTSTNSILNVPNSAAEQTVGLSCLQPTQAQLPYGISPVVNSTANVPTASGSNLQNTPSRVAFGNTGIVGSTQLPQTTSTVQQVHPRIKAKLRTHALQIIHPITNKNILQDLNNDKEIHLPVTTSISQVQIAEKKLVKASKSMEAIQQRDLSINQWFDKKELAISTEPKQDSKDATQQAEQISTHDVCVEIVPIMEERLKPSRTLERKLSVTSLTQSSGSEEKYKDLQLDLEEKPIPQSEVILKLEEPINNPTEPKEELDEYDVTSISIQNEALVETESINKDIDCSKTNTDTSSIMEDQESSQIDSVEISENENPFIKNEETEELFLKDESLLKCNLDAEVPLSPRDRRQYTRKQLMQLRQVKQSCKQPEVQHFSIFAPNNLMPSFAARTPKMVVQGFANYPSSYAKHNARSNRVNNCGTEEASNFPSSNNRNKGKSLIYINLSLNQDVQLNEANNAWRPSILAGSSGEMQTTSQPEKNELIRRIRGILNKLTPERFEPLVEEIIKLKIDTVDKMEAVMNLVFEKAIDEPNFSVSYAKLCNRLINEVKGSDERMESCTKSNLAYFRSALLDKTEREFTHHVTKINAKEEQLKPIREKYENSNDTDEKIELEALLIDEERKIRRRSGGTVRFIGELFKISILNGRIIHSCIEALLKDPCNEDMLECLCKLLTTVGKKFEQTCKGPDDKRKYSLKGVIYRMQKIATRSDNNKISSRVRFMLQDVIDLHKKKWQTTRNEVPQTMQQIEKEINITNQANKEALPKSSSLDCTKSQKSDQNVMGKLLERGRTSQHDNSHTIKDLKHCDMSSGNNSNKWQVRPGKISSSQAVDSSKLMGLTNVNMNNKKMGGVSLFQWPKSSSSQPQTSGSNSFAALSLSESNKITKSNNPERHRSRVGTQPKSIHKTVMEHERGEQDELRLKATGNKETTRTNTNIKSTQRNQNKYQTDIGATSSTILKRKEKVTKAPSLATPIAIFTEPSALDIKLIKCIVTEMLENALSSTSVDNDTVAAILRLPDNLKSSLLYYLLTDYLHLSTVKPSSRRLLANLVVYLIENKYLIIEHFHLAYKNFADLASDLIVDIPELWLYIFEFTGPLIIKNLLSINNLWNQQLRKSGPPTFSEKFLKSFIQYTNKEVGPNFIRQIWQKDNINWADFLTEQEIENFIKTNQFEFIDNDNEPISSPIKKSSETLHKRIINHVQQQLKDGSQSDLIIDYINSNLKQINTNFINNLCSTLISFVLNEQKTLSVDLRKLQNVAIPILRHYLQSRKDLQLECLRSINFILENLEQSKGLWDNICTELKKGDVIAKETFITWHNSKNQSDK